MNQILISFVFVLLLIACSGKENSNQSETAAADGAAVYKKYCLLCHGVDGKLGVNGAKDITISPLTKAERVVLITNGKNLMTPFKGVLTEAEIDAVADYTLTLK